MTRNLGLVYILILSMFCVGCATPSVKSVKVNPATPQPPNTFWFDYSFAPKGTRTWMRIDPNTWTEHYQNGRITKFMVVGPGEVDGNSGMIVRRFPDQAMDVFIPDAQAYGDNSKWLRFRTSLNGSWSYLAEMHF